MFISSALADDLLAKISNGAISDNSKGVKVLSLDEQKEVKGGYSVITMINETQAYAIAKYEQGEINYIANYLKGDSKAHKSSIDQESCSNPSRNRLLAFLQVTQNSLSLLPTYIVKRQVKISDLGQPYVLFTYGVGAYNPNTYQMYQFNSSAMLNNNMIIKEIANKYKGQMESQRGGWTAR